MPNLWKRYRKTRTIRFEYERAPSKAPAVFICKSVQVLGHNAGCFPGSPWEAILDLRVMPKKKTTPSLGPSELFFVKELAGEEAPSLELLGELYELSGILLEFTPWEFLDESQLILTPQANGEDLYFCSVMGARGEVFSIQAYVGQEGYRSFFRVGSGELKEPGEYLATLHALFLEFVPKSELQPQDKKLLNALGHPAPSNGIFPIFRAIRPGFHPWFVTKEEALGLRSCLQAVVAILQQLSSRPQKELWPDEKTYPLVVPPSSEKDSYALEWVKLNTPAAPALPAASLQEEELALLRNQDYVVKGIWELDYVLSTSPVGKKNARKAMTSIAMALDAQSGLILSNEMGIASVSPGELLAKVLFLAIRSTRTFPQEIHVRNASVRDSLLPLAGTLGIFVDVPRNLPAFDTAREHLVKAMGL